MPTGGKRIDTAQLATELAGIGVIVRQVPIPSGGTVPAMSLRDGGATLSIGIESGDPSLVQGVVSAHVARRQRRGRAAAAIFADLRNQTAAAQLRDAMAFLALAASREPGLLARIQSAVADDEEVVEAPAPP